MGQKGHIMFQKGLKMLKKRQKIEFLGQKRRFFSLAVLGGTPPPPLTENQGEKKKDFFLSGKGGYPPPPNGQNPLKRFWQVPQEVWKILSQFPTLTYFVQETPFCKEWPSNFGKMMFHSNVCVNNPRSSPVSPVLWGKFDVNFALW